MKDVLDGVASLDPRIGLAVVAFLAITWVLIAFLKSGTVFPPHPDHMEIYERADKRKHILMVFFIIAVLGSMIAISFGLLTKESAQANPPAKVESVAEKRDVPKL